MSNPIPSRRAILLGALAGLIPLGTGHAQTANGQKARTGQDNGIGGTGRMQRAPEDRGIGGTGVYGTIMEFGSIIVNGARITYAPTAPVYINGRKVRPAAMKIGHIVHVSADSRLKAKRIDIRHLVVGPVESVGWLKRDCVVLGQTIRLPSGADTPTLGEWVAISGIRRPDGVIEASLVEAASDRVARLTGVLERRAKDQTSWIGNQRVEGASLAGRIGMRLQLEGRIEGDLFIAAQAVAAPIAPAGQRLLIEGYASVAGGRVRFAEGSLRAAISGDTLSQFGALAGATRMIIDAERQQDGSLAVRAITVPDNTGGDGTGSRGGLGAPGGRGGPGGPGNNGGNGPGGPGGNGPGGPGGGGGGGGRP